MKFGTKRKKCGALLLAITLVCVMVLNACGGREAQKSVSPEVTEKVMSNWTLIEQTQEEIEYMRPLFTFVLDQFVEIFGEEVMEAEACEVFNNADAGTPRLITNQESLSIRVSLEFFNRWARFIYQLSHELTHYVIRQYKEDKEGTTKWFEETVCEAMSLYILQQSSARWSECSLSEINPSYDSGLDEYLDNIINDTIGESVLKSCRTLAELQEIERTSEERRIDRSIERNNLYDSFRESPEIMSDIVLYSRYAQSDLQLDLDRWEKETDNKALIDTVRAIHPVLTEN